MPGNVQNAIPVAVLPPTLSRAFGHARQYPVLENQYRNGESQRSVAAATSRKSWRLSKRLTPALLAELRDFYEDRKGPIEPFYFYDPYETNPKFSWDPTGQQPIGRYTVRFNGDWNESIGLGRADVAIELIELA